MAGRCRASPAPGPRSNACTRRWSRPASSTAASSASSSSRPTDFLMPEGGLNIRLVDTILGQEARLHDFKRDAMLAFVRANKLNKIVTSGGRNPKIGIITTGKAYLDVRQALDELGLDEVKCNDLGLRLFKIGCAWPIGAPGTGRIRARARPHHRGRGEAFADRSAGARGTLRHRQSAGLHRQEGRAGQLAVPGQGRARSQRRRRSASASGCCVTAPTTNWPPMSRG